MTMLAAVENKDTHIMTLADYEARIYLYKEQIGVGYIGIGRTLIEAKEADVVPHGEWEAWVTRTTGLNPRQAQRCMQAAREIKDGSALARLEMSKALLVLSSGLDQETQEQIAQQAADEGATVKELRQQIEQQKQDLAFTRHAAAEETRKVTEAKLEALEAKEAAQGMESALREVSEENERLRGQLQGVQEYVADQQTKAAEANKKANEYSKMLTSNGIALTQANENIRSLRHQLEELKAQRATGISAKAQAQIDELRADLEAAEAREEKRADELEQLRREHQQRAMDDARGLATSTLSGFDLAAAVRAFIGSAGVLPQMGPTLRNASQAERETIRQNIETVATWVESARAALGVYAVPGDAFVVE